MGSFPIYLCWVRLCLGRDVVRPGMPQFGVMNLCPSTLHSSRSLGKPGAEGSSEEPHPTVLAVPLEGRNIPTTPGRYVQA